MRIILFTAYKKETHEYLRILGNDVHRIDELIASGQEPTFIVSHYRDGAGWRKGLSALSNPLPGAVLDENGLWVNANDFHEWHGGDRHYAPNKKSKLTDYVCNLSQGFLNDGKREI